MVKLICCSGYHYLEILRVTGFTYSENSVASYSVNQLLPVWCCSTASFNWIIPRLAWLCFTLHPYKQSIEIHFCLPFNAVDFFCAEAKSRKNSQKPMYPYLHPADHRSKPFLFIKGQNKTIMSRSKMFSRLEALWLKCLSISHGQDTSAKPINTNAVIQKLAVVQAESSQVQCAIRWLPGCKLVTNN